MRCTPGITYQGSLAEFFVDPGTVDNDLFEVFCKYLRVVDQVNGSFCRRVDITTASGLPATLFDRNSGGETDRASTPLQLVQEHVAR